jgi:radical SAM superfamily enzyme YgiQ (UPF0313 family)
MSNVLLISYDNDSHIPFFPMNLFYLAGALKEAKHNVGCWFQDIHHGSEESLTKLLDENPIDVVGLGFCAGYWQYEKAKKISKAINNSKRRKDFIYALGGHGPAGAIEYFLHKMEADSGVLGDGEKAICEIIEGKKGIVQGEPITRDEAPIGVYEEFPLDIYRLIRWPTSKRTDFCFPILSSRGCKWHCSFCYRMREGFWERSIEAIIEEIKWLHHHVGINHFNFADELLMSSERRTEKICEAILALDFKIKWDCSGRLNFATSPLLMLMKKSGAQYINYGIESLNQKILNQMGKGLTLDQIVNGVEATLTQGLSPGLNLLWGFPMNNGQDLREEVEFLKKYDPCHELRTIRPVTPYPGCPLFVKAVGAGLVRDAEDFYENKHKNSDLISVNFMDMPIEMAHQKLLSANLQLIQNYYEKRQNGVRKSANKLYNGDTSFRGFREV